MRERGREGKKEGIALHVFHIHSYAFGLEQTNYKDKAEEVAREAMVLERQTPWAIHTLSEQLCEGHAGPGCHVTPCAGHVIEEARPAEDGVQFLTSTRQDWAGCLLGGHISWHLTLYHLGKEGTSGRELGGA